jgi:hypothetical protein
MKLQSAEAGVNDGKAGLLSSAGIFHKAGIFDKKSESFNIQNLNPYLLFDAESSMRGTLEAPTLDLDPATPSSLDVITAVRAGVATYTDASGLIQSAIANTVRVDHVDGVPMMLIEPSATNLLTYSEDFSNSWWTKSGVSVVSEETPAPDGSSNVLKMVENTSNSTHSFYRNSSTVTLNAHSFSVFAKTNGRNLRLDFFGGNNFANFDLTSGSIISTTGSGLTASIEPINGGWFRCSITQVQTSTTIYPNIQCLDGGNNFIYQGDGTSGVYIWGAQVETGSVATSYIPTSGGNEAARTRAADDLTITGSAFSDFYNQSEGTFYVESVPNENTSGSFLFDLNSPTSPQERLLIYHSNTDQVVYHVASGTNWVDEIIGVRPAAGALSRVAISYETNNVQASLDGVNMVPDLTATMATAINKMTIGNRFEDPRHLNGRIKRLIYWPTSSDRL